MDINRNQGENLIDYTYRIIQAREDGLIDVDKSEIYNAIFNETVSSDHSRKILFGIKKFIERLKSEGYENVTEDKLLKKLQIEREELKKERMKLQTENIDYNRRLREQARADMFEERIIEALSKRKPIQIPDKIIVPDNNERAMLTFISDAHYGTEFTIYGMNDEILNQYNPEIFERRMWNVQNKIIDFARSEGFNTVYIADLADEIEGMIHLSQLMSLRYGVTESTINYVNFMETWLNELSKHIFVKLRRVKGNHSDLRLISGNKNDFPTENMSKIVNFTLQKSLKHNPNIEIKDFNKVGCVYENIVGFDVLFAHGQDEKGNLTQAFKDYIISYKINIDYFCVGHLHSTELKEIGINKECIQCPSLMGVNDYSMRLKKTSNAGAKIIVLKEGYGRECEYNIILK